MLTMTIPEILKELEPYTGHFPMKALQAAVEQRQAMTPELLRVVEVIAANPAEAAKRENYMLPVFALYLLAQFREKRAYPHIVKMFSAPGETSYDLAGDTVTEGLKHIFASVYDGNPAPLRGLIENDEANEYVRDAAINALVLLERSAQMPRDEVIDYFRSLFHGRLRRTPSLVWSGLVCAVADLPAPELQAEVRQAYAEDLIDESVADLAGIERDLAAPKPWPRDRRLLIMDAIAEMERWACFHPGDSGPPEPPKAQVSVSPPPLPAPAQRVPAKPLIREPKIGRNDLCPCGSGKKYKKCCGRG
jgi:hypothetical protein